MFGEQVESEKIVDSNQTKSYLLNSGSHEAGLVTHSHTNNTTLNMQIRYYRVLQNKVAPNIFAVFSATAWNSNAKLYKHV